MDRQRHIRVGWASFRCWCGHEPSGRDLTEGQDDTAPKADACRACRRARTEDAARTMRELHKVTSAPAPLEHCPFSLAPPRAPGRRQQQQGGLFD